MPDKKMTKKVGPITLGNTYEDSVHGFKGVATVYSTCLTGCNRVCLEKMDDTTNELREMWLDETRLKGVVLEKIENGPMGDPPRRGAK